MTDAEAKQSIDAIPFSTLTAFLKFRESHERQFSPGFCDEVASKIAMDGIYCNIFEEHGEPEQVRIAGDNYRESIVYRGMNSRLRPSTTCSVQPWET